MSFISRAKAKIKAARDVYAKYQAEANVRRIERDIKYREDEELKQSSLVAEAKRLNDLAERREKTNQLTREVKKAEKRKRTAERIIKEEERAEKLAKANREREAKQKAETETRRLQAARDRAETASLRLAKTRRSVARQAALPKRKPIRITPKRPALRR